MGQEKWKKHLQTIDLFWDSIEKYFGGLNADGFKIFQDSLVFEGEMGKKIVDTAAGKGSRNYAVIKKLLEKNAKLMKTEDLELVKKEAIYITKLAKANNLIEKIIAYFKYKLNKGRLLEERDKFIAKTINESLKEGETGILFIGAFHTVVPQLAEDITVIELKKKEKIERYQKIYYLKTREEEIRELTKYLSAPILGNGLK